MEPNVQESEFVRREQNILNSNSSNDLNNRNNILMIFIPLYISLNNRINENRDYSVSPQQQELSDNNVDQHIFLVYSLEFDQNNIDREFQELLNRIFQISEAQGPPPASQRVIENLSKLKINEENQKQEPRCCICLEEFQIDQEVVELPCKHIFDKNCVENWLKQHNTCPQCRYQLPTEEDEKKINEIEVKDVIEKKQQNLEQNQQNLNQEKKLEQNDQPILDQEKNGKEEKQQNLKQEKHLQQNQQPMDIEQKEETLINQENEENQENNIKNQQIKNNTSNIIELINSSNKEKKKYINSKKFNDNFCGLKRGFLSGNIERQKKFKIQKKNLVNKENEK